ncbi:MAG: winged helix DNA-binding protein [Kiritimatiellae bacterium]|nr:winged helix DNA-binding protein [Kiritimatiellia bacterium]
MASSRNSEREWLSILHVANLIRRFFERKSKENYNNVTIGQSKIVEEVFYHTFRHGEGIMLKELARNVAVSASSASQSVEQLVSVGILERAPSQKDRRAVVITPSAKMLAKHDEMKGYLTSFLKTSLAGLDTAEIDTFFTVLERIEEGFEQQRQGK